VLVVADTTPLNYLILIDATGVLPALFDRVCVPYAVRDEMSRDSAPAVVRSWIAAPPPWFEIVDVRRASLAPDLDSLDAGEREAISLTMLLKPDFVLVDERRGTQVALRLGLRPTGTLGVLDMAATRGLIDLRTMIGRLQETNFRSRDWTTALLKIMAAPGSISTAFLRARLGTGTVWLGELSSTLVGQQRRFF
jgi:predicted nucleic acid-binding protein